MKYPIITLLTIILLAGCATHHETFGDLPENGGGGLLVRKSANHQP